MQHIQRDSTPEERFGRLVRAARESRGWAQETLSRRLKDETGAVIDQSGIARIEAGRRGIRLNEVVALIELLGINWNALLEREEDAPDRDRTRGVAAMLALLHQRREEQQERLVHADATLAVATKHRDQIIVALADIQKSIDEMAFELAQLRGFDNDDLH